MRKILLIFLSIIAFSSCITITKTLPYDPIYDMVEEKNTAVDKSKKEKLIYIDYEEYDFDQYESYEFRIIRFHLCIYPTYYNIYTYRPYTWGYNYYYYNWHTLNYRWYRYNSYYYSHNHWYYNNHNYCYGRNYYNYRPSNSATYGRRGTRLTNTLSINNATCTNSVSKTPYSKKRPANYRQVPKNKIRYYKHTKQPSNNLKVNNRYNKYNNSKREYTNKRKSNTYTYRKKSKTQYNSSNRSYSSRSKPNKYSIKHKQYNSRRTYGRR